jgi:hypothetical protein
VPDTTVPDTTVPDTTVPDTTVPDTTDPDVPCTPTCGLKQCGDDGCGSVCGTCGDSQICTDGMCVNDTPPPCEAQCDGKQCGDNGCDGVCGTCGDSQICDESGQCVDDTPPPCEAQCADKQCGDDGCDGSCGTCADSQVCDESGQCVDDVVPPIPGDGVDLSGYVLEQAEFGKTFTIPEGTKVPVGGSLIIGRKAEKDAFMTFWGITDDSGFTYINSNDKFPSLNGDETYAITDGTGTVWDGPSVMMEVGFNYQRTDAKAPSSEATSWVVTNILAETEDPMTGDMVTSTLADVATPGSSTTTGPANSPVVITEISDAVGNNNYVYEFIEITVFAVD